MRLSPEQADRLLRSPVRWGRANVRAVSCLLCGEVKALPAQAWRVLLNSDGFMVRGFVCVSCTRKFPPDRRP